MMKTIAVSIFALSVTAGCGGGPPVDSSASNVHRSAAPAYQVLHSFKNRADGMHPAAPLIEVDGILYGTTGAGGSNHAGTVYDITTGGEESVLHNFGKGADGRSPSGGLIDVDGTLYGTTASGGSSKPAGCGGPSGGCGTVYQVRTTGAEKVLHSFSLGAGGRAPVGGLIDVSGMLYGTTLYGGSGCGSTGCGTVYRVTTTGSESTIYRFKGGSAGAFFPTSKLLGISDTLYGATNLGGSRGCYYRNGCGTVFSITTAGKENWLYSFAGGSDGSYPDDGLIDVNGTLYGTTSTGGGAHAFGTVYSIGKDGSEKIVHRFSDRRRLPRDGFDPETALIAVNGTLYGTTTQGGAFNGGTIYSISANGKVTDLHDFGGGSDGFLPQSAMIYLNGTLYGTTYYGGGGGKGTCCGTVFALSIAKP